MKNDEENVWNRINKTVVEKYACQYSAVIARVIKTRRDCQPQIQRHEITQEGDYKMMSDTCILIIYTSQEQ